MTMAVRLLICSLFAVSQSRHEEAVDCGGEGYLHMRLCEAWEDRRAKGIVSWPGHDTVRTLGGRLGIVAQSAPGRGQKRLLNITQLNSTRIAFDDQKFHFGKVAADEVLLCFNPRQETACQHTATLNTCHLPQYASVQNSDEETCGLDTKDPAVVIINKHPVCRNHIVLVPSLGDQKPQALTDEALVLGLAFAMRASPRMWLSFNTVGAGASVNHLHLQAHLRRPQNLVLAAEPRGPVSLWQTQGWPLRGWAFRWDDEAVLGIDTSLAERRLGEFAHAFVARLQALDMAHNVLISSGGRRVIVFPRRVLFEQGADVGQLQVSGHEILGWWIVPRAEEDLDEASTEALLRGASLPEADELKVLQALRELGWQLMEGIDSKPGHLEAVPSFDPAVLHAAMV
eukprot:TRINITY_DN10236_c2_g1_i1.p1 TRINITY_DN10236_c2_g1~~TRINITY_DN10236_c2_g1_i1.p1  ORF type:complete len:399 (-),score=77.53 TRINITY_DN10236_c2_g1_i1:99-1295(-)